MRILIKNALYFDGEEIRKGDIAIDDGIIKQEITAAELEIDGENLFFMPGLVNAHHHTYSSLARGVPFNKPIRNFYENLYYFWWSWDRAMDQEAVYYSALVGAIESVRRGITTIIDHHASYGYVKGSLREVKKAFEKVGVRGIICYEISDRLGKELRDLAIEETRTFLEGEEDEMIKGVLGLHAAFTLSDETLEKVRKLKEEFNKPIHVHLSEDRADTDHNIMAFAKTPVERFAYFNILDNAWLAHGIHLFESDYKLIKENNAIVLHNVESNMNNKVGYFNLKKFKEMGIPIALGTDGFTHSILTQYRTSILLASHLIGQNYHYFFFDSLFKINYQVVNQFFEKTGRIKPGYKADIIGFYYPSFTEINTANFPYHLFFGFEDAPLRWVIINGKPVIEDGRFATINVEEVYKNAREVSKKLWERFLKSNYKFYLVL